jgi:anti-sigma-K factor RskA
MIDEQLEEQAALYVLGALEPEETHAFEARLASDEELREHVRTLLETTAALAHAAPVRALPPELEWRVMGDIRSQPADKVTNFPVRRPTAWIPWAIAACLAIACAVVFSQRQQLATRVAQAKAEAEAARAETAASQSRIAALASERDRAEQEVVELRQREADARAQMATLAATRDETAQKLAQMEARQERAEREAAEERRQRDRVVESQQPNELDSATDIQVATLTSKFSNAPEASAVLAWDSERQRGVLNTNKVPPTGPDRDYQLWIVDSRFADPIDAGVFRVEKSGSTRYVFKPKIRVEMPSAFAVSVERRGGVAKAEGPIVLAGK